MIFVLEIPLDGKLTGECTHLTSQSWRKQLKLEVVARRTLLLSSITVMYENMYVAIVCFKFYLRIFNSLVLKSGFSDIRSYAKTSVLQNDCLRKSH